MTRRDEILKLIVEEFIKTHQPVASKTLLETYRLEVCSATIRSEMNSLEADGYIEKPHTSGGRIPTTAGYRYYVEHLSQGSVDEQAKNALQTVLGEKRKSIEEVMESSCKVLSEMTNLASAVLGQGTSEERLVSVQLIPLSKTTASAIFVTDGGYVENKTFVLDERPGIEAVQKAVGLLDERLRGTPVGELGAKMEAMKSILVDYLLGQEMIYDFLYSALAALSGSRGSVYGADALLSQPEFQDPEAMKELMKALAHPDGLENRLSKLSKRKIGGVDVSIGHGAKNEMSILSTDVKVPGSNAVSLTLLGPTRMDYNKALATLRYFAEQLDSYFNQKGDSEAWTKQSRKKQPTPAKESPSTRKTNSSGKRKAEAPKGRGKASRKD